jgi:hypothetical protein
MVICQGFWKKNFYQLEKIDRLKIVFSKFILTLKKHCQATLRRIFYLLEQLYFYTYKFILLTQSTKSALKTD